jgi:hypothetical protein
VTPKQTDIFVCLFVCKIGGCRLMEAKHATYWQELLMDQWECMIHNKPLPSTPSLTLPSMRPCSLWTSRCRKDTCTLCLLFNGILWILVSLSLAHLTTTSICGTNTLQVEQQFRMPGKVYAVAMSAMATTHMLVASGTEDVRVRLCDLASGAFTHTLSGHRGSTSSQ